MVLTRELLASGAYLDSFADLPGLPRWSLARIEASMQAALAERPKDAPVWLFAYGSLIWNPLIHYAEKQPAVLDGWHRSFCLRLLAGRATVAAPGRMLALAAGDQCAGVAFRVADELLRQEFLLVWIREMVYGIYRPVWAEARLAGGACVHALTFVADPALPGYTGDASVASVAPVVARARGPLGSNLEYLLALDAALAAHAIDDRYVRELALAASAASRVSEP